MRFAATGFALVAAWLSGCGSDDVPPPGPVELSADMMARFDGLAVPAGDFDAGHFAGAWSWKIGNDAMPVLLTAVGDAVYSTPDGVFWLDTATADTRFLADDVGDAGNVLEEADLLRPRLVQDLEARHGAPGDGEIYSMIKPVPLGGSYVADNYVRLDSVDVHFVMAGQLLERVSGLPDGTPVGDITID